MALFISIGSLIELRFFFNYFFSFQKSKLSSFVKNACLMLTCSIIPHRISLLVILLLWGLKCNSLGRKDEAVTIFFFFSCSPILKHFKHRAVNAFGGQPCDASEEGIYTNDLSLGPWHGLCTQGTVPRRSPSAPETLPWHPSAHAALR